MFLNASSSCNAGLYVTQYCSFNLTIQIPANTPTDLHLEIYSTDNVTNGTLILSKPIITIGQNYNITTLPIPQLNSSFGDARVIL